jgi:hypothetical protein
MASSGGLDMGTPDSLILKGFRLGLGDPVDMTR